MYIYIIAVDERKYRVNEKVYLMMCAQQSPRSTAQSGLVFLVSSVYSAVFSVQGPVVQN